MSDAPKTGQGSDGTPRPPKRRCCTANRTPTNRNRVYDFLFFRGDEGATDEEGSNLLKLPPQCYVPRRGELVRLDLVRPTGGYRRTATGCWAKVWVVTPFWEPRQPPSIEGMEGGFE
jgi:hypothetical protein